MDSNFKYIQLETGEKFYVICDVYSQCDLDEFLSISSKHPVIDIGPTYYHKNYYDRFPVEYPIHRVPKWLAIDAEQYYNGTYADTVETLATYNFMLNKPNTHRFILLKLLECMFPETEYYTYSGVNGFDRILYSLGENYIQQLQHIPTEIAGHLVHPIRTKPKFYADENTVWTDEFVTTLGDSSPAYNRSNYDRWLRPMFESTAVSLITESIVNEKQCGDWAIHFSEKTLFSVLGLNFPIWVGGYGQAEAWASLGFDTFDDVINHSYQYNNTLVERCYYALHDNRHILDNLTYATQIRNNNLGRLRANRDLLLRGHLNHVIKTEAEKLPSNIANYIQHTKTIWFDSFDSKQ
jgi:hypothetical protein